MEMTELVRRAQAGDQEAMGELYQQTSKQIYALALRLTGRPELAMDAVQDTYLSAMQNLEKLRDPKALTHWLAQIAANRCRKLLRKEGRYVSPQQDEEDTSFLDAIPDPDEKLIPETAADDGETRRLLRELIDDLPQAQRECMILFYFSQCPVEQIAQVQECSEGTVKSRLNYGRKKLKEGILALEARAVPGPGVPALPPPDGGRAAQLSGAVPGLAVGCVPAGRSRRGRRGCGGGRFRRRIICHGRDRRRRGRRGKRNGGRGVKDQNRRHGGSGGSCRGRNRGHAASAGGDLFRPCV